MPTGKANLESREGESGTYERRSIWSVREEDLERREGESGAVKKTWNVAEKIWYRWRRSEENDILVRLDLEVDGWTTSVINGTFINGTFAAFFALFVLILCN